MRNDDAGPYVDTDWGLEASWNQCSYGAHSETTGFVCVCVCVCVKGTERWGGGASGRRGAGKYMARAYVTSNTHARLVILSCPLFSISLYFSVYICLRTSIIQRTTIAACHPHRPTSSFLCFAHEHAREIARARVHVWTTGVA